MLIDLISPLQYSLNIQILNKKVSILDRQIRNLLRLIEKGKNPHITRKNNQVCLIHRKLCDIYDKKTYKLTQKIRRLSTDFEKFLLNTFPELSPDKAFEMVSSEKIHQFPEYSDLLLQYHCQYQEINDDIEKIKIELTNIINSRKTFENCEREKLLGSTIERQLIDSALD